MGHLACFFFQRHASKLTLSAQYVNPTDCKNDSVPSAGESYTSKKNRFHTRVDEGEV